jgi:hypothetical protein
LDAPRQNQNSLGTHRAHTKTVTRCVTPLRVGTTVSKGSGTRDAAEVERRRPPPRRSR